ncbi:hypothetical protein B0H17DRAFT_1074881 [Mycena rosella]|uniref:F-box domain-containing protein n=1 Tax=Mycena rosella TaxID=1033263 RepID=A0AAD7D7B0_MYCRO|nr:hypothetical protein B0H17DRAFT_1074881 [Mycena rosella]
MYPVLTLPVEIVDEIFLHCLPILPHPDGSSWTWACESLPPATNEVPLLLSSICSAWRAIALSSPSLWTSLALHFESVPSYSQASHDRASLCQTWLSRSRELPLHLSLRYRYPDVVPPTSIDSQSEDGDTVLDVLRKCSLRWKTLRISVQRGDFDRLCRQLNGRIPLLDTLCVDIVEGGTSHNSGWIQVFWDAPALQNLSIATPSWFLFLPMHLPVNRLKRLCVTRFAFATFLLSLAPHIQECSVYLDREGEREILPFEPVPHAGLRSLRLLRGERHGLLLDCLAVPALQILELTLGSEDQAHFINFMARSSCPLQILSLSSCGEISADALLRCLAATPSLTELTMDLTYADHAHNMPDALISTLLTTLRISGVPDTAYRGLAEMLATSSLRDFTMEAYECAGPDLKAIQALKALAFSGMGISLSVDGYIWV